MSNPTTADDVPPPPYTVKEFENSIHEALLTPEVQNQFQMNVGLSFPFLVRLWLGLIVSS